MTNNPKSLKIDSEFIKFLNKFGANRVVANIDDKGLSNRKLCNLITKYFKNNNESYLGLIKTREDKNV